MIIDKFENLPLYFSCLPRLDRAAEFLAGENIADGHYEIDGEKIFDSLFEFAGGFADADIAKLTQYLLTENRERMLYYPAALKLHHAHRGDWAPLGSLKEESEEYSKGGDIAFYSGDEHMRVTLSAGEFLILFPGDAHKPCIRSGGKVKKAVVKLAL